MCRNEQWDYASDKPPNLLKMHALDVDFLYTLENNPTIFESLHAWDVYPLASLFRYSEQMHEGTVISIDDSLFYSSVKKCELYQVLFDKTAPGDVLPAGSRIRPWLMGWRN